MVYLHILYDQLCGDTFILMAPAMSLSSVAHFKGRLPFHRVTADHIFRTHFLPICVLCQCAQKFLILMRSVLSIFVFQVGSHMAQDGLKLIM